MKIKIIGGGPAGLYFAILMKLQDARHEIIIYERDAPDDTFGWGIVFSDQTFSYLQAGDRSSFAEIVAAAETWDNVDVVHRGRKTTVRGNKFSGLGRLAFLQILRRRCAALGVELHFGRTIDDPREHSDCDLLIGADGANSVVRRTFAETFEPTLDVRLNKYIWLGTHQLFHGLTLTFRPTAHGLLIAHSYKFNPTTSTFIVECSEEVWRQTNFAQMSAAETCNYLGEVFSDDLAGHALLANDYVKWINFVLLKNKRWFHEHVALLGDALHTVHFSIGSGTKLALEDAIALAECFAQKKNVTASLAEFERVRKPIVEAYQDAARASLVWFENAEQDLSLDPLPFTYKLMTRSDRLTYDKLKRRDPAFIKAYDGWRERQQSE